jgi:DMSO/TMAO reductase YedYZ molybdopterin-dependent catalytic subunit
MKRRLFIASTISSALAACSPIGTALNDNAAFHHFLGSEEVFDRALIGTRGLAQTYPESAISPHFPVDSLPTPADSQYADWRVTQFRSYRMIVDGAVEQPQAFSLSRLHAMTQTSEITRHDCVEGWSAIAKWSGVRVADILSTVRPRANARYVVFHCMDRDQQGTPYYESLDMHEAYQPQTLLALRMNGAPIPPRHGAPVRLRVPTQLGYKSAKWVARVEVVSSFANLGSGKGGYWEDQGYEWYAGV